MGGYSHGVPQPCIQTFASTAPVCGGDDDGDDEDDEDDDCGTDDETDAHTDE